MDWFFDLWMDILIFSITDDEAKEVHRGLRTAAGIFQQVKVCCTSESIIE